MRKVIVGTNVSEAWLRASNYLDVIANGSFYNLVVQVDHPMQENTSIRCGVDQMLSSKSHPAIETVASTIFPKGLLKSGASRSSLYTRFANIYPRLRNVHGNRTGTYFGRLVQWNFQCPDNQFNQVEAAILKLTMNKSNIDQGNQDYQMSIYDPNLDNKKTMGFPCMSFISLKVRGDTLDMTAMYRSQYFIKKAYGNYLGLGRLLHFMASETGYNLGKLTCISTLATMESSHKTLMNELYIRSGIVF